MSAMTCGRGTPILVGVLIGLAGALFAEAPASAHAVLTGTNPAAGVILRNAPASVTLAFSEPVRAIPGKIQIIGPYGRRADHVPTFARSMVTIPLFSGLPNGTYFVSYRVLSEDSHPVSGGFTFSVGAPSAVTEAPIAQTTDPVVGVLLPVAEYLGYAGLVLLVGPVFVLLVLWPPRLSRRQPISLARLGIGLIGLSTVLSLTLQAPYATGSPVSRVTGRDIRDVVISPFGLAMVVRLAALGVAVLVLRQISRRERLGAGARSLSAALAAIVLGTWSIAGHPVASPLPPVSVLTDFAHLAAMAIWLGGLVMLLVFLLPRADETELQAILPRWSRWAAVAVGVLVGAGSVQAFIEIRTLTALIDTRYGQLVLLKIGLLGAVLLVAAYSRRLVQRRVATGRPRALRRSVSVELGITAVVLVAASVLVQTTPGRNAAVDSQVSSKVYASTLTTGLYTLQIQIDPVRVGSNYLHLYAYTAEGFPQRILEWRATAALPKAGVERIDIPVMAIQDHHAFGEMTVPAAGDWQIRLTLRTSETDQESVTTTVAVK